MQRDRLTGYAIDDNGGYRIPMAVDGVVHAPRFHPCSDALCLASGANIDFSDPATLRWIRSVNAKTAEQVSFSLAVAAVGSPAAATGALAWGSTGVGILAGFLNESTEKALSAAAVSTAFHSYATSKGLSPAQATRLASAVEAADGWSRLVDTVWIGE